MIRENLLNESKRFSWKARARSFVFAWAGILAFFRKEHNAQVHLAASIVVLILSCLLGVSKWEALVLVFAIALVWITEMLNTAIEKTMDLLVPEQHPVVGTIKDLAAGAVLVASVAALVAGCIIFIPKILL